MNKSVHQDTKITRCPDFFSAQMPGKQVDSSGLVVKATICITFDYNYALNTCAGLTKLKKLVKSFHNTT